MKHFTRPFITLAFVTFLFCQEIKAQSPNQESLAYNSHNCSLPEGTDHAEAESAVRFSAHRKKNHILTIESSKNGKLTIVDESEKILYQQPILSGTNEIKLQGLESGKYKVKVKDQTGKLYRTKLIYVKVE